MKKLFTYLTAALLVISGYCACKHRPSFTSPKGYNLNKPEKFSMPESLHEISGIAFYHRRSDTVYSIQDEDGRLYRQAWGKKKQEHTTFGGKGDYEDLAILDQTVMVLESKGTLYTFPLSESRKEKVENLKVWKDILPKGEYESIYADQQTNQVYFLCKNAKHDKKSQSTSGYIFTWDPEKKELISSGRFSIDVSALIKKQLVLRTGLKVSALTKNTATGEWYLLSSVNKALVVTGPDWKIKSFHHLNSSIFVQPEGIAFDDQMNLFISNEGDEFSSGSILKFKPKP